MIAGDARLLRSERVGVGVGVALVFALIGVARPVDRGVPFADRGEPFGVPALVAVALLRGLVDTIALLSVLSAALPSLGVWREKERRLDMAK